MPEYIVITLIVAASGKLDLPMVSSQDQLIKALNRLAAVRQDQVSIKSLACRFDLAELFETKRDSVLSDPTLRAGFD